MKALLLLLAAAVLQAETAVLECTRAQNTAGFTMLTFRDTLIQGWTATRATLVIHVERGVPKRIEAAAIEWSSATKARPPRRWTTVIATHKGEGWWQVDLPASLVQPLTAIAIRARGATFHTRDSAPHSPYLVFEGRK